MIYYRPLSRIRLVYLTIDRVKSYLDIILGSTVRDFDSCNDSVRSLIVFLPLLLLGSWDFIARIYLNLESIEFLPILLDSTREIETHS